MGWVLSHDQSDVAPELGIFDAVLRVSGGHPQGDLYHQRDRVTEHVAAESDKNPRVVSQPGGRLQAAVAGLGAYRQEVDNASAELESRFATFCDSARRSGSESGADVDRCGSNGALWKCRRVETMESERHAFHRFHAALEISQRRRDSHIPTAPTVYSFTSQGGRMRKNWCAVGKWKSKTRIPTFPPHRWPAAQGRS